MVLQTKLKKNFISILYIMLFGNPAVINYSFFFFPFQYYNLTFGFLIHVYAVRVGVIYLLSGIGGSILSSLFIRNNISVGASGALFGLLGAMLSELFTNWTIYTNKVSSANNNKFSISRHNNSKKRPQSCLCAIILDHMKKT